jgi:DNA-binding HxlR family transcriptional regulator
MAHERTDGDRLLEADSLRFNELLETVDGITNKVLSESLDDLEDKDLVDRTVVSEKPVRVEYALTDRGRSLRPVIEALEQWGSAHLRPASSEAESYC